MKKILMKKYFDNLVEIEKKIFLVDEYKKNIDLPNIMLNKNKEQWVYVLSSVTEQDLEHMQKKYNVIFPEIYKQFISTYAHLIKELHGKLNNFLFEDDVDVILEIPEQVYGRELETIELVFESNKELLDMGFIPIGEFEYANIICIDLLRENRIFYIDLDDYYECEDRKDMEEKGDILFDNFEQLLECFFMKKTHDCSANNMF